MEFFVEEAWKQATNACWTLCDMTYYQAFGVFLG